MSNTENRGENELRCSECGEIIKQKNELALGSIWEIPGGLEKLRNKMNSTLREELVSVALKWQERYGIAPQITTPLSEYDAAMLVGFPGHEYSDYMQDKMAVGKGSDFVYRGVRYQIKGCRPSGKPGSSITMVPKATNYEWDVLIWIRYDRNYAMQEAWQWDVEPYKKEFHDKKRISLGDIRHGRRLFFCLGKVERGTSVEKDIDDLWD